MDKEKNSIERQKYQMIKTGFDIIGKWLEKIANKKEEPRKDIQKIEIAGVSVVTLKGDNGHTPTDEELLAIIKPLIPVLRQPKDGRTPTKEELLAIIKPLIKNGETPSDEKLLSLIKPLIPEAVNEQKIVKEVKKLSIEELKKLIPESDTAEEIIKKLLSIKRAWLPAEAITGDLVQHITRVVKQFGGSSGGISESRVRAIIAETPVTNTYSKSFVITNPTAGMTYALWKSPANITIIEINAVQIGGTNLVGSLTECDANGLNPVAVDSTDMTITTSNTSKTSFTNPSIDSGDWIGWKNTSVSGAVGRLMVTFNYTN